ncbi:MAG: hypothetical protein HZA03_04825 [Nitrospinae bacterium]|nr:hypothetical protein [Nitrospinota bacterium]
MKNINILLVDDDKIDRMAVVRLVRAQNLPYNMDTAGAWPRRAKSWGITTTT